MRLEVSDAIIVHPTEHPMHKDKRMAYMLQEGISIQFAYRNASDPTVNFVIHDRHAGRRYDITLHRDAPIPKDERDRMAEELSREIQAEFEATKATKVTKVTAPAAPPGAPKVVQVGGSLPVSPPVPVATPSPSVNLSPTVTPNVAPATNLLSPRPTPAAPSPAPTLSPPVTPVPSGILKGLAPAVPSVPRPVPSVVSPAVKAPSPSPSPFIKK